jgi:hypothetical protein
MSEDVDGAPEPQRSGPFVRVRGEFCGGRSMRPLRFFVFFVATFPGVPATADATLARRWG